MIKRTFTIFTLAMVVIAMCSLPASAQVKPRVSDLLTAERTFNELVARDGIGAAFLAVSDTGAITFGDSVVKIHDRYRAGGKDQGVLQWVPDIGRISFNGDLAFSSGGYHYRSSPEAGSGFYGDYVSVWHSDSSGRLRLLVDMGIGHPQDDAPRGANFSEPRATVVRTRLQSAMPKVDNITVADERLNRSLRRSPADAYRNLISVDGRYLVPQAAPFIGAKQIAGFLRDSVVSIFAETLGSGQAFSDDLAYTYGRARVRRKAGVTDNFYLRIWVRSSEDPAWRLLVEGYSAK